jgi:plasmid stabilization system protein ParE
MKIHILSLAVSDLETGIDFYKHQQAGLGTYFLDTLFSDIEALLLHAGLHARYSGYFRALSKRIPHAINYKIHGDDIEIWRVLDYRQNPARTKSGLKPPNLLRGT